MQPLDTIFTGSLGRPLVVAEKDQVGETAAAPGLARKAKTTQGACVIYRCEVGKRRQGRQHLLQKPELLTAHCNVGKM